MSLLLSQPHPRRRRRATATSVRAGRALAALWLLLVGTISPAFGAGSVTRKCGVDPVANTATVLCVDAGACDATSVSMKVSIDVVDAGCAFDLGGRTLTVSKTLQMTGAGFIQITNVGDVTITSTGKLKARGDFVLATATPTPQATPTATPTGGTNVPTPTPTQTFAATGPAGTIEGGLITITSSGTITDGGLIDVTGDPGGTITVDAVGDVLLQSTSTLQGNGIAGPSDAGNADGGTVQVVSRTGGITDKGTLVAVGRSQASGGEIDLTAAKDISVQQAIDASGGGDDGGCIDIEAGDNVTITKALTVDSNAGAGSGGNIVLAAGEDSFGGAVVGGALTVTNVTLRLNGSDSQSSGGDGGELDASANGPMKFTGANMAIRGNGGNLFDGSGGVVCLDTSDGNLASVGPLDGDITVNGLVVLQSGGDSGDGGFFEVESGHNFTLTATVDTSGADNGGDVSIDAGGAIAIDGPITAQGRTPFAQPGGVELTAGESQNVGLTITQDIDASGGASNALGDLISLAGCSLTIANGVKVIGQGGTNILGVSGSSEIDLVARSPMHIGAAAQVLANPNGTILTFHPPGQDPVIGADVVFNPARTDRVTLTDAPYPNCPGTATISATPTPSATATPTASVTPTPSASATPTPSASVTPTPSAGVTSSLQPSVTPTVTENTTPSSSVGTPTPAPVAAGRVLAVCQAAVQKAATTLVAGEAKVLQACVANTLKCVQTKVGPVATICRKAAETKCGATFQAFRAKAAPKLAGALALKCGPPKVVASDLRDVLGFADVAPLCAAFGVSVDAVAGVSACLDHALACRGEEALASSMPRAPDFLAAAGVSSGLCVPAPAGDLGGLPNPKPEGAAAVTCSNGIAKAALAMLTRALAAMQSCVAMVSKCELTSDAPATCVLVLAPKCAVLLDHLTAATSGVFDIERAAIAKACAALAPSDLLAPVGLGFGLAADGCTALGVTPLVDEADVALCVLRAQRCAAADMLTLAAPRAGATLAAVGQSAAQGLTCPAFNGPPAP